VTAQANRCDRGESTWRQQRWSLAAQARSGASSSRGCERTFDTIEELQAALDVWVTDYNNQREHQALGDVPPMRRFELARPPSLEVIDGDVVPEEEPRPAKKVIGRRVDRAGRISILKHRYHVGRRLVGEAVRIESTDGLLLISHIGVVVATHGRRHLITSVMRSGLQLRRRRQDGSKSSARAPSWTTDQGRRGP
jgi:hypothetical protein